jgi:Protein of unknown function (DUF1571)
MCRLLICLLLCLSLAPAPLPVAEDASNSADDLANLPTVTDDGSTLPDNEEMMRLAQDDPVRFLENCLRRYDREVSGYQATLLKCERLNGKLHEQETIRVCFLEKPFSVLLHWTEGASQAQSALYVKDANDGKVLVRPAGLARFIGIVDRDPEGTQARDSGRYLLTGFGIKIGTQRTLAGWVAARNRHALHVHYLGTKPIPELGGRVCHVLQRKPYEFAAEDGITELTTYIDAETWLQTGTILRGATGELVASYFFRDLRVNPAFPADTFTRQGIP